MKKSVIFLVFAIFIAMLSGCILSKTPSTNNFTMNVGEQNTFSVEIFPPGGNFIWSLDGLPLSNRTKSYIYTAEAGEHILIVQATHALGTDTQAWYIYGNSPPVANAGADQSVAVNATVTLDGSGSTDPDNNIVSYHWQQTDGPTVTLTNANTAIAQFTASVAGGSVLTFELTVTDSNGVKSTDTNMITIFIDPISSLLNSMVSIPAGTFMMGSTDNEWGEAQYTTPVHEVTLQAFDIGAYEVTQAQYEAIMGMNPSYFQEANGYPDSENNPVEQVSWYDVQAFCVAFSALTGRTFTLPSEAQWEYACRAGTTTLYSYGDSDALLGDYAWYRDNSGLQTHPVGTKLPNAWGLYDMHGNVWEWCLDSWHTNYIGAPTDGSAWVPDIDPSRVIRGGGLSHSYPCVFRSAYRTIIGSPLPRYSVLGFRVLAVR